MDSRFTILIAEDDPNDATLLRRAIAKAGVLNPIQIVVDGDEAIEYLSGAGKFADRTLYPFPGFLWLDLKMPKRNGFEVLGWLREHPKCAIIPVVVWSSSQQENDVRVAYRLGANCYFVKPNGFEDMVELMKMVFHFWNVATRPHLPNC